MPADNPRDALQQLVGLTSSTTGYSGAPTLSTAAEVVNSVMQGPTQAVSEQFTVLAAQVSNLNLTQQTQIGAVQDNTQAVAQNTAEKGSSGASLASTVGNIASTIVGGGLVLSPMVSGLLKLFGIGGESESAAAAAPVAFALPTPIRYEAGVSASLPGTVMPVSYGETGDPRIPVSPAPQINIQVNAIDSRSFLDHSDEIAEAVKRAIVNSHSLNDVIADL